MSKPSEKEEALPGGAERADTPGAGSTSPAPSEASSWIPRRLLRALSSFLLRRLPLRWCDRLVRFWIQTRLLFSRTILLMVGALFAGFSWLTIAQKVWQEEAVQGVILVQMLILAILLHMGVWEREREGKTLELLLIHIPEVRELVWLKVSVSLTWTVVLVLPFWGGFIWFAGIPLPRAFVYLVFSLSTAILAAFFTLVVASFVRGSLPAGIVALVLIFMLAGFMENKPPWHEYYNVFISPVEEDLTFRRAHRLVVNRVIVLGLIVATYRWLLHRLGRIEKWVA